jgi:hypothetical protein
MLLIKAHFEACVIPCFLWYRQSSLCCLGSNYVTSYCSSLPNLKIVTFTHDIFIWMLVYIRSEVFPHLTLACVC